MAEEFTAKFKVDISDLKKNIDQAQKEIKKANATFKAETAGMDKWSKDADGLSKKLEQLDKTLDAQKKILNAYKTELERNKEAYSENGKRAEELKKKLQELADHGIGKSSEEYQKYKKELTEVEKEQAKNAKSVEDLELKVLDQTAAVKDTEKQINHYETSLDGLDKEEGQAADGAEDLAKETKNAAKAAEESNKGFTVLKGALANLAAEGIKMAVSALKDLAKGIYDAWEAYDTGTDNIIKKTGATGKEAEKLTKVYDNVSKQIVGDLGDIGTAVGEVNTRFNVNGKELEDLTLQYMKFAEVNETDVTGAIDSSQAAMQAWNIEVKDAPAYLDLVTAASQATGASVDKINSALLTNATSFKEMGLSVQDAAFMLAGFEKNGVDSATALTGLKKALQTATKEGKPLSDVMQDLEQKIRGAKNEQEAMKIAAEYFGSKAAPALATAIRDDNLSFQELGLTMENFTGTVENTFEATQDGTDKARLALQNLKIEAGKTFGEFMEKHGPEISAFVNKFIKEYLPVLIQWLDKTFKGIETVMQIMKRWGQIFKDLGTAAKYEIERIKGFFDSLGTKVANIWNGIKNGAVVAWNSIKSTFSAVGTFFGNIWNQVKTKFTALGTKIGDAISGAVKAGINGIISRMEKIVNTAISTINKAIGLINMIPGVSVGKISSVSFPRLAQGGVLKKGQIGLLEGSGAEAVVPLHQNKKWIGAVASDMVRELTGGNTTVTNANRTIENTTNYTQIINAPKAPSRIEIYRQTRNLLDYAKGGIA